MSLYSKLIKPKNQIIKQENQIYRPRLSRPRPDVRARMHGQGQEAKVQDWGIIYQGGGNGGVGDGRYFSLKIAGTIS